MFESVRCYKDGLYLAVLCLQAILLTSYAAQCDPPYRLPKIAFLALAGTTTTTHHQVPITWINSSICNSRLKLGFVLFMHTETLVVQLMKNGMSMSEEHQPSQPSPPSPSRLPGLEDQKVWLTATVGHWFATAFSHIRNLVSLSGVRG